MPPIPSRYVSPDELARRVLVKIKVLGEGQEPTPDDLQISRDAYLGVHAEMTKTAKVDFPVGIVPREYIDGIVRIVAARCGVDFGLHSQADGDVLEQQAIAAYSRTNFNPASAADIVGQYF